MYEPNGKYTTGKEFHYRIDARLVQYWQGIMPHQCSSIELTIFIIINVRNNLGIVAATILSPSNRALKLLAMGCH